MSGSSNTDPTISDFWRSPAAKHYKADALFLLTALLIGKVLLLRAIRHRRAWGFVSFLLLAAGYLSNPAISYVLGLLNDRDVISRVTVMWAVFLVVLDGVADNTVSQSLEDNEAARKRFLWDKMLPSLWLFLVIFFTYPINAFWIPILLLWALFLLKLRERKLALIYACRSRLGLDRVTTIIVEYMNGECTDGEKGEEGLTHTTTINNNIVPVKPATKQYLGGQDYKYLVGVKEALERVGPSVYPPKHKEKLRPDDLATIDKIWQCEGKLLGSELDTDGHLKDTCLSFALFWRLLPRFADFELPELSRDKEWRFVTDVLLIKDKEEARNERVFRVVELELQFLRDYFYTNYFATYCSEVGFLLVRVVVLACYLLVSFITLKEVSKLKKETGSKYWYEISNLQYTITKIIIYSLSFVEFVHIVNMVTSRWNKMKWVCSYVQNKWWASKRLGNVKEWLLCQLCHQPFFRPFFRPWHRKLRQYSLLDSYKHTPFQLRFRWVLGGYMELPMIGQKESPPTSLSTHVMKAVLLSLHTNGPKLSKGLASLRRNNVHHELSWACKSNEITRIILVWHIATSMCEKDQRKASCCTPLSYCGSIPEDSANFRVATSLSKYCAYLVAFVPKLLPDHVYMTQWIFEQAVSEAREELKTQCCSMFNTKTRSGQDSSSEKAVVVAVSSEQGNLPLEEGSSSEKVTVVVVSSQQGNLPLEGSSLEKVAVVAVCSEQGNVPSLEVGSSSEKDAAVAVGSEQGNLPLEEGGSNSKQGNLPSLEEGKNLMEMGLCLAEQVKGLEDESIRWKVLADFWVELILFLAPSKDANEHAKHLVNGGEFITHLWALLTHAGIVDRVGLQGDNEASV